MATRRYSKISDDTIRDLVAHGLSKSQIAKTLECSPGTVSSRCKKLGLDPVPGKRGRRSTKTNKLVTFEVKADDLTREILMLAPSLEKFPILRGTLEKTLEGELPLSVALELVSLEEKLSARS